jgi:hypothetical protein
MSWNPFARRPGACDPFQDRLLASAGADEPMNAATNAADAELTRHLAGCATCRELADGLMMTSRLHPHWKSEMPPHGLALKTIEFLEPHWKRTEKPVNREEIRLIWTGALGMAGATAALLLFVADSGNAVGQSIAAEGILRFGARLTLLQLAGGTIVSVALLAIRAARSSDSDARPRERNRGGNE